MQRRSRSPSRSLVQAMADRKGMYSFILLALISFANAQSQSCPPITISDLGSTTSFSSDGLVAEGIVPQGESVPSIPVRIMNYTIVCDASGNRRDTSSYVSVVVQIQCDYSSTNPTLTDCDGSTIVTRQYQFQCIERNGEIVWAAVVGGNTFFVQTLDPTATLSTPLANQCRRCIDDQQSSSTNIDDTTHCDACGSGCNQGQGRCFIGPTGDVCCNFYLQGGCVAECPSALVADSNFDCVCPLLILANGDVSYSLANRDVGSVATHTCNSGYRLSLQGGETRACTSNGWDGQDVTCELIQCPDLTVPNGQVTISQSGRGLGSTTTYECNPGFALVGDGNRVCQKDSTWSGVDPQCADCSPALQDSNCDECGFDSNGTAICTMCREDYRVVDGQCHVCPLLSLDNGNVMYSPTNRGVGSVATHTCNTGYRLSPQGGETRTCNSNIRWDGQNVTCELIMCPDLIILNGQVTISPASRSLDSMTTYACNPGFALVGDGNRFCQEDSTWSGVDPQCADCSPALQDSNCEECGFDSNGTAICTMCREDYRVVDGQCHVCPLLSLENGNVMYSPTNRGVGSVATHTCNTGYRLSPQGGQTRTCNSNISWDGQNVTCELIQCPDLTVANGQVTISPSGRGLDSMTIYECDPGFALVGDGNRVCQEDSSWSGVDPQCADCSPALQDSNCEECGFDSNGTAICTMCRADYRVVDGQCHVCPLLSFKNGNVMYSPTNRGVGSVATHTCNTGYRLSPQGGETRTCNSNISWDGQNVTCELIVCPDLTVANGQVTISPPGRRLGSMTVYECGLGFVLVGDGNRVCQEDSSWSDEEPKCNPTSGVSSYYLNGILLTIILMALCAILE